MRLSLADSQVGEARGEAKPLSPLQDGTVYGPIQSRRLGSSLGINPLPASYKFCDFDCVYCQYGWTPEKGTGEKLKRAPELLDEIRAAFEKHQKLGTPVNCITIAGNGEPTIHPDFLELINGLLKLRDEFYPGVKIGVLTDSSQAHRKDVREALDALDERYMKLDAGDAETVQKINKPKGGFDFDRMIEALVSMEDIVVQSLFTHGSHDNTSPEILEKWMQAIAKIKPREVQVYTIDRGPADPRLKEVSNEELGEIAKRCETQTGVRSVVFD